MFDHLSYIVLDGSRMGNEMDEAKRRGSRQESLYRNRGKIYLDALSPRLFPFKAGAPFAQWCLKKGWGDSWGILIRSAQPFEEIYRHLRRFLMVQTDSGKQLYFRFYDPRVLRIFLPTCDAAQLRDFFGDRMIEYFVAEDEDPAYAIRFWHENGILKQERMPVADGITTLPEPEPLPLQKPDPLPPETVAALKAAGVATPEQPADKPPVPPSTPLPQKAPAPAPTTTPEDSPVKPKTKWNLFD